MPGSRSGSGWVDWGNTLIDAGVRGQERAFLEGRPGKRITFVMYTKKISNKRKEKNHLADLSPPKFYFRVTGFSVVCFVKSTTELVSNRNIKLINSLVMPE